tara:strand:+ start:66 stop:470 length:405 start_codon:yes stop_codon:yes gene_type:complete
VKNLLLILALFVGNFFAEEEFPIELTCEIGGDIVFFSLKQNAEKSWFEPHYSQNFGSRFKKQFFENEEWKGKKNYHFKKVQIEENWILLETKARNTSAIIKINRLSGKLHQPQNFNGRSGECIKGFKEYGERKF